MTDGHNYLLTLYLPSYGIYKPSMALWSTANLYWQYNAQFHTIVNSRETKQVVLSEIDSNKSLSTRTNESRRN